MNRRKKSVRNKNEERIKRTRGKGGRARRIRMEREIRKGRK